ncbi:MAG TPA: DMT family transporter [Vampirovibrionales bacterium]
MNIFTKGMWFGLAAAFCFSLMSLFAKFAKDLPSQELVLARSIFILIATYFVMKQKGLNIWGLAENRLILFLRGFSGYIALSLFFFSLKGLHIGSATLVQYLSPIFSSIFALFFLKEQVANKQWWSLIFCFIGIAFISGILPNLHFNDSFNWHSLIACLLSSCLSGIAYVCVRKLSIKDESADVIIFYFPLVSLPFALIASVTNWVTPTLWQSICLVGVCISSYYGQLFLTYSLKLEETSNASKMLYFGAVFASTWGFIFLNEKITLGFIVGACLIIGSQLLLGNRKSTTIVKKKNITT